MIDVSGWLLVAEWDARAAVLEAFPSFNDTWTVHDRTVPGADARSWGRVIAASPYRVDGVAEPARGSALSLLSEFGRGAFLRAAITAGATFQTRVHKPNEFALDFVADPFPALRSRSICQSEPDIGSGNSALRSSASGPLGTSVSNMDESPASV
ncbi:hypothetical protein L2091_09305 [Curtobacterium albidum]|uniref:hypothetical protein n=1 Tax=Curtobacterium citreum TaxID=2036 RepID=UPI0020266D7E|nr:hypothetical protein [Curtobacterium albidum]MCL9665422.1 hypothetical protein [Curtobacterium albidum]